MTTPQDFTAAREYASSVLAELDPSVYDQQTPCDEFDVRGAVNHLIGGMHFFVGAAKGELPPPDAPRPDFTEGDPQAVFARICDEFERTYVGETLERQIDGPRGPVPGAFFHSIATMECALHGWDIARGAGIDAPMPDALVGPVHEVVAMVTQDRGDAFAPAVPVADDAPAQDRLVALSGRQP